MLHSVEVARQPDAHDGPKLPAYSDGKLMHKNPCELSVESSVETEESHSSCLVVPYLQKVHLFDSFKHAHEKSVKNLILYSDSDEQNSFSVKKVESVLLNVNRIEVKSSEQTAWVADRSLRRELTLASDEFQTVNKQIIQTSEEECSCKRSKHSSKF